MPNYNSLYKDCANLELKWLPMDTYDLYQKNLTNNYELLLKNNWIDNHFTYKFNSLGFRCKEFTNDNNILCLGCSYTIGIGLPVHNIWPELLAKSLNLNCVNLGIGASSCDTAFRLCHGYINKINPKIVILLVPPGIRFELVWDDDLRNIMVSNLNEYSDFYKNYTKDENNYYFNSQKNILAINMLCQEKNIKFIYASTGDFDRSDTLARDLVHPGINYHKSVSNYFLEKI